MIICAPVPENAYDTMTATEFRQLCCRRTTVRKKKSMFSMAVTLRIRFDQGSESLEHPCLEVPKHRSPAQHTVRVALEPALGALSWRKKNQEHLPGSNLYLAGRE